MRHKAVLLLVLLSIVALAFLGCGEDGEQGSEGKVGDTGQGGEDGDDYPDPEYSTVTLEGQFVDFFSKEGIAGAAWEATGDDIGSKVSGTTDADGKFTIENVPTSSTVEIGFEAEGYESMYVFAAWPDGNNEGNIINEATWDAYPLNEEITLTVTANDNPVEGADILLDPQEMLMGPVKGGAKVSSWEGKILPRRGVTDAAGFVSFMVCNALLYDLFVFPVDTDKQDGIPDLMGDWIQDAGPGDYEIDLEPYIESGFYDLGLFLFEDPLAFGVAFNENVASFELLFGLILSWNPDAILDPVEPFDISIADDLVTLTPNWSVPADGKDGIPEWDGLYPGDLIWLEFLAQSTETGDGFWQDDWWYTSYIVSMPWPNEGYCEEQAAAFYDACDIEEALIYYQEEWLLYDMCYFFGDPELMQYCLDVYDPEDEFYCLDVEFCYYFGGPLNDSEGDQRMSEVPHGDL